MRLGEWGKTTGDWLILRSLRSKMCLSLCVSCEFRVSSYEQSAFGNPKSQIRLPPFPFWLLTIFARHVGVP